MDYLNLFTFCFAEGVTPAASFLSLINLALDAAEPRFGIGTAPAAIASTALLIGMGAVALMNGKLPPKYFKTGHAASLRRVRLFVIATTVQNFPERLAAAVGLGSGGRDIGLG